jgi:hypothetical protein
MLKTCDQLRFVQKFNSWKNPTHKVFSQQTNKKEWYVFDTNKKGRKIHSLIEALKLHKFFTDTLKTTSVLKKGKCHGQIFCCSSNKRPKHKFT